MENVIGYARISVSHEDIENQVKAIESYCKERGYRLLAILRDTITGLTNPLDRPAFRKILDYAKDIGIRKVIIYDVSRLGRSLSEIYLALRILKDRGIIIEFVKHRELNNMDEKTFSIFITTFGLATQLEREFLRLRQETARKAGKRIGRPPIRIPIEEVKKYMKMGLSKKDIYKLLIGKGYLRNKNGKVMTYIQFLRRLKRELE